MRRTRQHVYLDSPPRGADQTLDDDGVLVALVLQPQRSLCRVDEVGNAFAAVVRAPDQLRMIAGIELFARPVRFEALIHLLDFGLLSRDHGIIARYGEIARFPIEGLDESNRVVD